MLYPFDSEDCIITMTQGSQDIPSLMLTLHFTCFQLFHSHSRHFAIYAHVSIILHTYIYLSVTGFVLIHSIHGATAHGRFNLVPNLQSPKSVQKLKVGILKMLPWEPARPNCIYPQISDPLYFQLYIPLYLYLYIWYVPRMEMSCNLQMGITQSI